MTIAIPPLEATCHSLNGWWSLISWMHNLQMAGEKVSLPINTMTAPDGTRLYID